MSKQALTHPVRYVAGIKRGATFRLHLPLPAFYKFQLLPLQASLQGIHGRNVCRFFSQRDSVLRAFNRITGGAFIGFAALMATVRD